ncbi:MAG: hypothetical protein IJC72_02355 [Clostridia bacterium]|nr:hypothetical protein [Clostridia bacterium]
MKKIIKLITILMAFVISFSTFAGCGPQEVEHPMLPNYAENGKQFSFFTYGNLNTGTYTVIDKDGNTSTVDYGTNQTVEKYKEYIDCGFDILMTGDYDERYTEWEGSGVKHIVDTAYEAGMRKFIFTSVEMRRMTESYDMLIGEGEDYRYPSYEALKADIKALLEFYKEIPGFYGINLRDEPNWKSWTSFAYVYKAIREVEAELGMDEIYLHMNQLPIDPAQTWSYGPDTGEEQNLGVMFDKYVEEWLKGTGANRICCDVYAFRSYGVTSGFFNSLQAYRKMCDKYGADLSWVLQSCEYYAGASQVHRDIDKADILYEMFHVIGWGVDHMSYYTYMPTGNISATGTMMTENNTFLTRKGEKTNIYYWVQDAIKMAQKFAPVVLSYDFVGSKYYKADVFNHDSAEYFITTSNSSIVTPAEFDNSHEHKLLKSITQDNDLVFTTEMYDKANDLYMYMVQNIVDPASGENGDTDMNVGVTFDSEYTWVAEYSYGTLNYVKLENGVYNRLLGAGESVFLIPLK